MAKRGVLVVKVNPHGTSQDCSNCRPKVPKTLSVRLHECPKCRLSRDRDENGAVNILNRALNEVGLILSVRGGFGDTQPVKRETSVGSSPRSPRHTACSWRGRVSLPATPRMVSFSVVLSRILFFVWVANDLYHF